MLLCLKKPWLFIRGDTLLLLFLYPWFELDVDIVILGLFEIELIKLIGVFENSELLFLLTIIVFILLELLRTGKEYADVREAKQLENKYRILWSKTSQDVRAETTAAWEKYSATKAQIDSIQKQIKASQIALDGVIREANVGSRTVLDVLDAEQEHLDNQVSLVKAHREEIVSSFALMAAVGQLNPAGLGLSVEPYDPKDYYESVKNKWIGYGIE